MQFNSSIYLLKKDFHKVLSFPLHNQRMDSFGLEVGMDLSVLMVMSSKLIMTIRLRIIILHIVI